MQCFEAEVTRTFLLALCREVDPNVKRNELLLDEVLNEHHIHSVTALFQLGGQALSMLVAQIIETQQPAVAGIRSSRVATGSLAPAAREVHVIPPFTPSPENDLRSSTLR